jgi:hypothetical protein
VFAGEFHEASKVTQHGALHSPPWITSGVKNSNEMAVLQRDPRVDEPSPRAVG